jgi:cyclopropane-fatty-acyl-phospholipid synthase
MNTTTAPRSAQALPAACARRRAHGPQAAAAPAARHLTVQLPDGTLQPLAHGGGPGTAAITSRTGTCAAPRSSRATSALPKATSRATGPRPPDRPAQAVHRQPPAGRRRDLRHLGRAAAVPHQAPAQPQHAANSQKNIHAHYDLGNAFYELWLDDTMNYSSAWFEGDAGGDMRDRPARQGAPRAAHGRRAARRPGAGDRLRLGRAGRDGHHRVRRHAHRRDAVHRAAGVCPQAHGGAWAWQGQADLRLQDYRDIHDGPYDAICSIEMVEAVGREYWPTYFQSVNRLLKPGGKACIQSIVIDDACLSATSLHRLHPAVHLPRRLPALPARVPARGRGRGPARGGRIRLWPGLRRNPARWRERFLAQRARSCSSGLTSASCTSGSSTSPTAKPRSPWATSTWCSTRWSRLTMKKIALALY